MIFSGFQNPRKIVIKILLGMYVPRMGSTINKVYFLAHISSAFCWGWDLQQVLCSCSDQVVRVKFGKVVPKTCWLFLFIGPINLLGANALTTKSGLLCYRGCSGWTSSQLILDQLSLSAHLQSSSIILGVWIINDPS